MAKADLRVSDITELYESPFKPYFLEKRDYLVAGLVFLVAFIVYLLTLTPRICAGDSGELTTAIYNLGAAHPPGYPLYTMIGKLFTYIPVGTIAYRVNLLSAFFGALTIPFLFLFIIKMLRSSHKNLVAIRDYGIAASVSLMFAFSATQWSQSVIAEVYTLNIVFAPILLLAVLVWQERVFLQLKEQKINYAEKFLLLFAFLLGMSFTNHLLLIGYIIPFLIFFIAVFVIIGHTNLNEPQPVKKKSDINLIFLLFAFPVVLTVLGIAGAPFLSSNNEIVKYLYRFLLGSLGFLPIVMIFLAIKKYAAHDPQSLPMKYGITAALVVISGFSLLLIMKFAWFTRLLYEAEALMTIIGIFLPLMALGIAGILIMHSLPNKKGYHVKQNASNLLFGGFIVLTGLLILIFSSESLKASLNFMKSSSEFMATTSKFNKAFLNFLNPITTFDVVLVVMYLSGLIILVFAYFSLRKQSSEQRFFTNSVKLGFKAYLLFLIPMLLYVTLLIRANAIAKIPDPPLSWGETANASRVINHFLRKQYPKATMNFLPRIIEIFGGWGKWHLNQFTPFILLFVPFGLFSLFRRNKLWAYLTGAIFIFFNLLLLYFLSFKVTPRDLFFNEVFFIPSYVLVATWIAFGMQFLIEKVPHLLGSLKNRDEVDAAPTGAVEPPAVQDEPEIANAVQEGE